MSQDERTGTRDLLYSRWHRAASLSRFVGKQDAFMCAAIDIDYCEWCAYCHLPVALVETQRSRHQPKDAPITLALANMAGIECYSVSYWSTDGEDIDSFKVRSLRPAMPDALDMTPQQFAEFLRSLRWNHPCVAARRGVSA